MSDNQQQHRKEDHYEKNRCSGPGGGLPGGGTGDAALYRPETVYTAYPGPIAEIRYVGDAQSLTYRKTAGYGDPSGDYTAYENVWEAEVNGTAVTLKGDGGLCTLALWQADGYTGSLRCAAPVEESVLTALAAQLCTPAS